MITAVFCYGFAVTHESIGVDDTIVQWYFEDGLTVSMGRWTVFLLNKLFHMSEFVPFITDAGGVILLLAATVLFCVLLKRIFGERIEIWGYTVFSCVLISQPFISETYVYYGHNGMDIGYVLLAMSLILFMEGSYGKSGKRLVKLLGSMLLLWAAVGCYEAFLILYVVGILMILLFRSIMGKEDMSFKLLFRVLFPGACIGAGCIFLRFLMQKCLTALFSLPNTGFRDLSYGSQLFGEEGWLQNIFMLFKKYWLVYFVNGAVYFPVTVYVLAVLVFAAACTMLAFRKKSIGYLLVFAGMLAVPFLLTFAEMKPPLYRACQYMPFFIASAMILLYLLCSRMPGKKYSMVIFGFLSAILIWNQAFEMNRNFYTDYQKYEYDKKVLTDIAGEVIRIYGENSTVIFTGDYRIPYELVEDYYADYSSREFQRICVLTDWLDPHLKEKYYSPYGYSFAGEAQYSLIEWGLYAYDHPGLELIHFLQMHGYRLQTVTEEEIIQRAELFAEELPRWPEKGAITEMDGYVVVHF